jgi:hypothetical protein
MHDGQRKTGSDGGVYGVAALAQNLDACIGGQVVHRDDHAVTGANGLGFKPGPGVGPEMGIHLLRALLGNGVD